MNTQRSVVAAALLFITVTWAHASVFILTHTGHRHELIFIPAGSFTMGGRPYEGVTRRLSEGPVHSVYLDSFYIDACEVTNELYDGFVWATEGREPRGRHDESMADYFAPQNPVVGISWYEAAEYCNWAGLRLPTEAEWEKAARGMNGRNYPWGNDYETCVDCDRSSGPTLPVGSQEIDRSPYGVADMGFSVSEWVEDWYSQDFYSKAPSRIPNPRGPLQGDYGDKVHRGGSFGVDAYPWGSVTGRSGNPPAMRVITVGFRCASSGAGLEKEIVPMSWGVLKRGY